MSPLQWGRDDGVAEDTAWRVDERSAANSFNGAATMGSRKTRDSSVAMRYDSRFNGAATMGSRKTGPMKASVDDPEASMGPRRWGRGRRETASEHRRLRLRFNGAATMGSRKT